MTSTDALVDTGVAASALSARYASLTSVPLAEEAISTVPITTARAAPAEMGAADEVQLR